jgi:hypothetical protein
MNNLENWSPDDLEAIGQARELKITIARRDGQPAVPTTVWVVRVDDGLYVRSYLGPRGSWYRRALHSRQGRIRAGRVARAVALSPVEDVAPSALDAAYRAKYGRSAYTAAMVAPSAAATTLRLTPD